MTGHVLSPLALRDLGEIDDYIGAENRSAAERLLATIEGACTMLAENPAAGRRRDDLLPGIRSFPVGSYVDFYRQVGDGIEILRVLHGRRDIDRAFRTKR